MTKVEKATRGRPASLATAKGRATALKCIIENDTSISRFLKLQLVDQKLLETVTVQNGKRGRPAVEYKLTGKGRGLVALSENWK